MLYSLRLTCTSGQYITFEENQLNSLYPGDNTWHLWFLVTTGFKIWPGSYSVPSHNLNRWWYIANWTLREIWEKKYRIFFFFFKKMSSLYLPPSCRGLSVLMLMHQNVGFAFSWICWRKFKYLLIYCCQEVHRSFDNSTATQRYFSTKWSNIYCCRSVCFIQISQCRIKSCRA